MNPSQQSILRDMWLAGYTTRAISAQLNLHRRLCCDAAKAMGLPARTKGFRSPRPDPPEPQPKQVEPWPLGMRFEDIANPDCDREPRLGYITSRRLAVI